MLNLKSCERILIIHPFGVGDALLAAPLTRILKENGVKEVDLLLGSRTREIFETNPNVTRIFEWDKTKVKDFGAKIIRQFQVLKMIFNIWKKRYRAVFDLTPTGQYAAISLFYFWIPVRIGFNFRQKGFFLTHRMELPEGFSGKSVLEYYLDLLTFFGLNQTAKPELFLTEKDEIEANQILKQLQIREDGILTVSPGGGESWGKDARLKRWPIRHFGELVEKMKKQYSYKTVLVLGGKNEIELGESLIKNLSGDAHNLCGKTSIRAAASLIQKSQLFIGNDGGLVHLAAAVRTPVLALYGPVDPAVYGPSSNGKVLKVTNQGPVCRPCYERFKYQKDCVSIECLTQLLPQQVLEQIQQSDFFHDLTSVNS